jgi:hypothetical protein
MSHSPFYQQILAEGRAEGELQTRRTAVLEVLAVRFGEEAAAEFQEALNMIADGARLSELHRTAIKYRGISGFRRALQPRDP